MFVTNLPFEVKWKELKDFFRDEIGDVNYAEIFNDESGRPRGTGIVELSSPEAAAEAIRKLDKYEWKGRKINVKEALNVERDQFGRVVKGEQGRSGRTGGGGSGSNPIFARKVYISNLPYEAKWTEIKDIFREEVGNVAYVELYNDETGRPRGCGIMEFDSEELAKKAIRRMNKFEIKGRKITVQEALDVERDKYGYPVTARASTGKQIFKTFFFFCLEQIVFICVLNFFCLLTNFKNDFFCHKIVETY